MSPRRDGRFRDVDRGPRTSQAQSRPAKGPFLLSQKRQFKFVSHHADHIICNFFDSLLDETGTEDIKIAKWPLLRNNDWDGETRTIQGVDILYTYADIDAQARVAKNTDTLAEEDQVIVPPYVAEDIVYASQYIVGGTNVDIGDDDDPERLVWLDDNSARAWTRRQPQL